MLSLLTWLYPLTGPVLSCTNSTSTSTYITGTWQFLGILSRSAAKIQIACIRLFKNNCAGYIQCSSSLLCLPSEHQDWLLLIAAAQSGSEMQFSGAAHFYFPTGYCFPHTILEGFLGWHFYQGYWKLIPASHCVREEWELVYLHIVLGGIM